MSLRRTMPNQNTASPPLRYRKNATDLFDRLSATGGAQKVSFDASCRIALSSARSATSFFSCAFSRSRSLALRPPTAPSDAPGRPRGHHIPCATDTASARDPDLPTCLDGGPAPPNNHIHLTQLRDDLLRRKSLTSRIFLQSFRPLGLSSELDQLSQGRPLLEPPVRDDVDDRAVFGKPYRMIERGNGDARSQQRGAWVIGLRR